MPQRRLPVFALVLLLCAFASNASAEVPGQINHEGLLVDANGLPKTGRVLLDLAIYDVPEGGVALWSESYQLDLVDGYYSVTLGLQDDRDWVTGPGDRYLGITVDGPPELRPRRRLLSVPWSLVADNAVGDITPRTVSVGGAHGDRCTRQLDRARAARGRRRWGRRRLRHRRRGARSAHPGRRRHLRAGRGQPRRARQQRVRHHRRRDPGAARPGGRLGQ